MMVLVEAWGYRWGGISRRRQGYLLLRLGRHPQVLPGVPLVLLGMLYICPGLIGPAMVLPKC
jgi:hypothetical protein